MFIINLIPLHVFVLLLMQRFSRRVYIGEHTHTHTAVFSLLTQDSKPLTFRWGHHPE